MQDHMQKLTRLEILRFVLLAYVLGFGAQLLAVRAGVGHESGGGPWLALTMWTPAIAAFLSGTGPRRLALRGLKRFGWRHLAAAFVAGSAFEILGWIVSALSGTAEWNSANFAFDATKTHVDIHKVGTVLGAIPSQSLPLFFANLMITVAFASILLGAVMGIGEEIGWRGVLQPALVERFGFVRGTVVVGLVWAYWHLPVNLAGYNDDKHPVVTALVLFPIGAVALAFMLGWVFRRSGSIWACGIAHMANNSWSGVPLVKTPNWTADNAAAITAAVVVIAVVIGLVRRGGASQEPPLAWATPGSAS